MMRSMFSAVSGLSAHQLKMDVIGNNVANVNTVGFKSSQVTFSTVYSQTLQGAGAPSEDVGGTNPMQVGLGSTTASINTVFTNGATQRTDNPTDLMVDGKGFFVVTNDPTFENKYYTRAGNFVMDKVGNLVTPSGFKVLGTDMKPIQVNMSDTKGATATSKVFLNGNINFDDGDYTLTSDVYDSIGRVNKLSVQLEGNPIVCSEDYDTHGFDPAPAPVPASTKVTYTYKKMSFKKESGDPLTIKEGGADLTQDLYAKFNSDGEIVDLVKYTGSLTPATDINANQASFTGEGQYTTTGADTVKLNIDRSMFFVDADVSKGKRSFTQYAQDTDVVMKKVDGNSAGSINSFSIAPNGDVIGVYTNGKKEVLSTIALATFDNEGGLMQEGGNMFTETPNSGDAEIGSPSSSNYGSITAGALEMSNVDLAAQFTDMITTQRGYQACSRVIKTSDDILNELVNLR